MLLIAVLLACSGGDDPEPTDSDITEPVDSGDTAIVPVDSATETGTTSPTGDTGTTLPTGSTGSTASTGDTGTLPVIDCAALSPTPLSAGPVSGARAYHGIAITDGKLYGTDGSNLIEADGYGGSSVFLPGTGRMEQLDVMSDGTIVGISGSDIVQIFPTGGLTVLASVSNAYGIRVGPDDKVYVADWSRITRIDPATGTVETWLDGGGVSPKVLDFSVDLTKMYIGSISDGGRVYEVDLDANYDPIAAPRVFASTPNTWHDGLEVDVCGNLYVAEYYERAMYRISPSGSVTEYFSPSDTSLYGHGVVFGNGEGPFDQMSMYIPQPYNGDTVSVIETGVPYRTYTGPVINQP